MKKRRSPRAASRRLVAPEPPDPVRIPEFGYVVTLLDGTPRAIHHATLWLPARRAFVVRMRGEMESRLIHEPSPGQWVELRRDDDVLALKAADYQ